MAYCTLTDIQAAASDAELIRLTDDAGRGEINETAIAAVISQAGAIIDGWIGGIYSVPLTVVPAFIAAACADIALWLLFTRRDVHEVPEGRKERHKQAIDLLKGIAAGKVIIPTASAQTTITDGTGGSFTANERMFTRENMAGF